MSSRKIEDLTPRMQVKINNLLRILKERGLDHFKISCTYRTQEEQNALWSISRFRLEYVNSMHKLAGLPSITEERNRKPVTHTKHSIHTQREAVDFYVNKDGKYCNDLKVDINENDIPDWEEFAKIATECGLECGFYWKGYKCDPPHVQWKD